MICGRHTLESRTDLPAIKLLVTAVDDPPVNRSAERTVIRVVSLANDFLAIVLALADVWREVETLISLRLRFSPANHVRCRAGGAGRPRGSG